MPPGELRELSRLIHQGLLVDRRRFLRRLEQLHQGQQGGRDISQAQTRLHSEVQASVNRRADRLSGRPQPRYPDDLPVSQRREEIAAAIRRHPVVIVAGETGSGKTTQLPKICLELGRGAAGLIGCTQPRRIAATSIAQRVARELGGELGGVVGYKVRFAEQLGEDSYIKFLTDGMLLAEIQQDRGLWAYDTLILDEAHERSLNIDFLLGYLKGLLPRRPDLKLIISSATLDTERFARYFGEAPIIAVAGRTYPVELRYRPPLEEEETDLADQVADAVEEVLAQGRLGDVLVFLPGEREIRETATALGKRDLDRCLILPLYARLSGAEQAKVFQPTGQLHIVLATNVAETSLTIPGIRYVIDSGLARINRYSPRSQVSRLRIEPISRASADQRKGRCGRVGPGICIRLYGEDDYLARPAYTDPEIRRTSLAAVILSMRALGLGEPETFPFIEAPHPRQLVEGYQVLQELQALDEGRHLTELGRQLARLPVDPRLGRMVLAAAQQGALQEVLVIAAALSIQDPRERPLAAREGADERHRRYLDERSDFTGWLKLWAFYLAMLETKPSRNGLRRWCRENFLSYTRLLEWSDVHQQLANLAEELKLPINDTPASYEALHRALLSGLLSRIGLLHDKEKKIYQGARGTQFAIFPGSGLFGKGPRWLVASEVMETTRVYARGVARIEPEWLEALALHLVRRSYSDPHWEKRQGRVVALEQVTLYGLPIVTRRRVDYGPIDPVLSRELFIRAALVQGDYATTAVFFRHNQALTAALEELEHKSRRRDVLVDEETVYAFYNERLPPTVWDHRSLEGWRREVERQTPQLLHLDRETLMRQDGAGITPDRFPDHWTVDGQDLPLSYRFEPGHPEDGVTVELPLKMLPRLESWRGDWLVPGLLLEKLTLLIKALPKSLRVNFIPAPDYGRAANEAFADPALTTGPLPQALSHFLQRLSGVAVPLTAWRQDELPDHLRMNYRIRGEGGDVLSQGRVLADLRDELSGLAQQTFQSLSRNHHERENVTNWDFGTLAAQVELKSGGVSVYAYPALADEEGRCGLRLFDSRDKADRSHRQGLRRLFALQVTNTMGSLEKSIAISRETGLAYIRHGGTAALRREIMDATLETAFLREGTDFHDPATFQARLTAGRPHLGGIARELAQLAWQILGEYHRLTLVLGRDSLTRREAYQDMQSQLINLVYPGFLLATPLERLRHYPRYLKAMVLRLEKMDGQLLRDKERLAEIAPWWQRCQDQLIKQQEIATVNSALLEWRWLLEEWRVSLFAQELKTAVPVSGQRVAKAWGQLELV